MKEPTIEEILKKIENWQKERAEDLARTPGVMTDVNVLAGIVRGQLQDESEMIRWIYALAQKMASLSK